MFFDTNVMILHFSGKLESTHVELFVSNIIKKTAYVSFVVVGEILAFSDYTDEISKDIEKYLYENFKVVNQNKDIILLAAKIARHRKQKTGKKLKLTDAVIAATAILNNKPLFTLDKDDFGDIDGLKLV